MTFMNSDFFEVEIEGPVAHLIMNRPEKANGMNQSFWDDLPVLVEQIDADKAIRTLVISGRGKHFSGGMDLTSFSMVTDILKEEPARAAFALRKLILRLQNSFTAIERSRLPVIAAIHGACVGGAIDMITACDMRLASSNAFFSIEEINIGMTADVGTLQRLPKLVPEGIAKELAFTGRRFTAREGQGWGLINSIHESAEQTIGVALELARELSKKSPLVISGIKNAINYARDHQTADSLDQIATWNAGMLRPEDLMGAIQAKMQKQEMQFKDLLAV